MSDISFSHITKYYEHSKTPALDDIDLSFTDHETTAVIGASGSGKSTLLQLINGLLRPSSGAVALFGNPLDYQNITSLRRHIGYAIQGTGLFPHMTVFENIMLLGKICRWEKRKIKERVEELMDLVELPSHFISRYPHELSGGEQQRVGLCRALFLNPRVLLLDEAFGALDAITKQEVHKEFLRLKNLKRTTILVTHDAREALKLAEHIIVLHKGRVLQHGTAQEVLTHPANDIVKKLFEAQLS